MPLQWTHQKCGPACPETTECHRFPTVLDRLAMARSAYVEYSETDGTWLEDIVVDVLLFAADEIGGHALESLPKRALAEWNSVLGNPRGGAG